MTDPRDVVREHLKANEIEFEETEGVFSLRAARREEGCRPRFGSTSAPTRWACTPSSAAVPTRSSSGSTAGSWSGT
ncbi:hypothetical protein [Nocardioides convexus]|uniref:hypothetical protein n=1 Tax=Nocardioides convexus TaxID=2712224 RepID=UPI00241888E8|nr:hypothetical protein [Nocardioides convexus]